MGATLWYHEAPWHPDAAEALKALQARFLAENYDLGKLLPEHLAAARESVAATEADGDPYDLLEHYQDKLVMLQRLSEQPIPESPEKQIKIIRRLWSDSGEGIGNILDLTGIAETRKVFKAQRLAERELVRLVGTAWPTLDQARHAVDKINEELGRGECVCFPAYEAGAPVAWYFVGNTVD